MTTRIQTTFQRILQNQIRFLLLAQILIELSFSSAVILIPLYMNDRHMSFTEISIVLVGYYILSLTTATYFGAISDKIGRKRVLLLGVLLASITYFPLPYTTDLLMILALNSAKGLASAMIAGPILALFADLSPANKRGEVMGMFYLSRGAGSALGFIIAGFLWDVFLDNSFVFFGMLLIAVFILILAFLNEPHHLRQLEFRFFGMKNLPSTLKNKVPSFRKNRKLGNSESGNRQANAADGMTSESSIKTNDVREFPSSKNSSYSDMSSNNSISTISVFREEFSLNPFQEIINTLKNRDLRLFLIAWLAYTSMVGAGIAYAPLVLRIASENRVSGTSVGMVFLLGAVLMGAVQPFYGKLSDKIGRKPLLLEGVLGTSLLIVLLTAVIQMDREDFVTLISNPLALDHDVSFSITNVLTFRHVPNLVLVLVLAMLMLLAAAFVSVSMAFIVDLSPESERGRNMGLVQSLLSLGTILGTLAGGFVVDLYGILGILVFSFILSLICVVLIMKFIIDSLIFYQF